jgi:putative peptidoglycan lipid II flippase
VTTGGGDWSRPSLYTAKGRPIEPRMFTEADPISAIIVADWDRVDDDVTWGSTTYVGPRRRLPKRDTPQTAVATAEPVSPDAPFGEEQSEIEPERGLIANTRTMAIGTLVSRVTGFLRNSLLVAALGIHGVANAYNLANNFPNMVYELLLGGVLSSVLVPLLVHAQEDDPDRGVAYTQRLLSVATAVLGLLTLVSVACAPLLAAAFVENHSQRTLAGIFATLLLPEIFFYGLGAMVMAVLNVRHSFAPGAWAPVLNNVVVIATVLTFWALPGPHSLNPATMTNTQILVLGIGTTLGIAAQALVLFPALRRTGFHWQWRFRAYPNEVGRMREVGTLAFWVLGYVVASQIGVTVVAKVGITHDAFTVFTNADLLVQMPYGILVVSLLTALMPRLSRAAAREQRDDVIADLGLGARLSAVALLPIVAGLIVLGQSLTVVLFGYGEASVADARLIGTALAASAFGLFPFALVMLQLRVFYAMRDGRTPTLINIFMVATKVLLIVGSTAIFTTSSAIAVALTVATSASYVIGAVIGHVLLVRRLGNLHFGPVLATVARVGAAATVVGLIVWGLSEAIGAGFGHGHAGSALTLIAGALVGLPVLVLVLWRMRIPEIQDIVATARRR